MNEEELHWGDELEEEQDPYDAAREKRIKRDGWNAARLDAGFQLLREAYDESAH